ncbi:MAG: 2-oxoacid:acceptor oxidoreductase family protein [Acidobacteria bacterium]|nr:2-oxoacid:acceptor oxidoreductase family protein [Acidobacteriota bacterium]
MRLSGEGGQGLILAGKILAEAAAVEEGRNAVQSQSYGPEARGGASKSDVIIADGEIDDLKADSLDLFLAFTQDSLDTYHGDVKPGGLLVIEADHVALPPGETRRTVRIPFQAIAREKLGRPVVANIVALGAIVSLSNVVSVEAAEAAVLARVPKGTEELNRQAFRLGVEAGGSKGRLIAQRRGAFPRGDT